MSSKRPLDETLSFTDALDKLFRGVVAVKDARPLRGRGASRGRYRRPQQTKYIPCGPGYNARYGLARPLPARLTEEPDGNNYTAPEPTADKNDDDMFYTTLQPVLKDWIIPFLAPHEMLQLLRCNKCLWALYKSIPERRNAVLKSLFAYLRISEECAANVAMAVPGGWRAFSPVLVQMCEVLTKTYGYLEPDPAHRAMVAEQACFSCGERRYRGLGKLAAWEIEEAGRRMMARGLTPGVYNYLSQDDLSDEETNCENASDQLSVLSLKASSEGTICWGDPDTCLIRDDDGFGDWLERNRAWMQTHANDAPNMHIQLRLEDGLHPLIWVMSRPGMYIEYALTVGPDREQGVVSFSSYYDSFRGDCAEDNKRREERTESFYMCLDSKGPCHVKSSFVEFLINYACPAEESLDADPTKCMAIWCLRHKLEPFTDETIEWTTVFKDDDPFLLDALTCPDFGPANFETYKERLGE